MNFICIDIYNFPLLRTTEYASVAHRINDQTKIMKSLLHF